MTEAGEREKIFGRVREALKVVAPRPGHGREGASAAAPPSSRAREYLPRTGETREANLELFAKNAIELKAELVRVENRAELAWILKERQRAEGWNSVASHSGELTDFATGELGLTILKTDGGYDVHELERCDVAVTECDALIAQTGSVLVTARTAGGRALSVLPPYHIVLARPGQLLADLPAAFDYLRQKYGDAFPSFISLITGPSRTGDIERILVLGAHGPKRLTIILVEEV